MAPRKTTHALSASEPTGDDVNPADAAVVDHEASAQPESWPGPVPAPHPPTAGPGQVIVEAQVNWNALRAGEQVAVDDSDEVQAALKAGVLAVVAR